MKVCCVFSLESPHRGDSNEYAHYTIINIKKKKKTSVIPIMVMSTVMGCFPRDSRTSLK